MSRSAEGLPELELDRLRELATVGAGWAARALGSTLGRNVRSRPPTVHDARSESHLERSAVILFEATGDISAILALVLPAQTRDGVLQLLLGRGPDEATADIVESALQELGNIVASQTVSAIADTLGARILLSVPTLVISADASLANRIADRSASVRIESSLDDREGEVHARLLFWPDDSKQSE